MKRSTFTIENRLTGQVEVDGLISKYFGLYKIVDGGYSITHLKTGYLVCTANKMGQARNIIELLDSAVFPCTWDSDNIDDLSRNVATTASIVNSVLYSKED